ncbi:COG3904 family protein [Cucumibacter marinus]|uniref:COG3904 family protein n=1 Tax=Cucumibacter marinus TaxID=1121252 RepID=UPI0003FE83AB|nr:hypothetical protein [Cucumibacter marinus]
MIRIIRLALAAPVALWLLAAPGSAGAAEIKTFPDREEGCTLSLEGLIEPGDRLKLKEAMDQVSWGWRTLCLDSPGGSLAEAVRMGALLQGVSTRIEAGRRCVSACAVLFMAGRWHIDSEDVTLPDRVMHATAGLGFHAPALSIAEGNYSADTVAEAYDVSTEAIAQLISTAANWHFPNDRLTEMLATSFSDMRMIETVEDAARWDIEVAGIDWPETITPRHVVFACQNALQQVNDLRRATNSTTASLSDTDVSTEFKAITRDAYDGARTLTSVYFGFGDEGDTNCSLDFYPFQNERRMVDANYVRLPEPVEVSGYMFYPGGMRLADLAAGRRPEEGDWQVRERREATCTVVRDGQVTDQEVCDAIIVTRLSADLNMEGRTRFGRFTWPSGAVTSFEHGPERTLVNGKPGDYVGWIDEPEQLGNCLHNIELGSLFCHDSYAIPAYFEQ